MDLLPLAAKHGGAEVQWGRRDLATGRVAFSFLNKKGPSRLVLGLVLGAKGDQTPTRVVALKIIELAQRGVRDAPTLTEMALKELKHYLPHA